MLRGLSSQCEEINPMAGGSLFIYFYVYLKNKVASGRREQLWILTTGCLPLLMDTTRRGGGVMVVSPAMVMQIN